MQEAVVRERGTPAPPRASALPEPAGTRLGPFGRTLFAVCKGAAVIGALVFTALVAMSIVSITGRKLFSSPVPGDVELLQLCAAFASASFFAYCHMKQGDVKVDFFTDNLPPRLLHVLDSCSSLLVGLFGALIAWRTAASAQMVAASGETTMILGLPVWIGQLLMVPGFVLLALAGLYMSLWHLRLTATRASP